MITILAIGKKHESWVLDGIERYQKRLRPPFDIKWDLLPHSSLDGDAARREESERMFGRLDERSHVMLLDETGKSYDTPTLSGLFDELFVQGQVVTIVIGGAFGVDERLKKRADTTVSLSKLVFPHQLVRLMLAEQLYRCQEISRGGRYHHL